MQMQHFIMLFFLLGCLQGVPAGSMDKMDFEYTKETQQTPCTGGLTYENMICNAVGMVAQSTIGRTVAPYITMGSPATLPLPVILGIALGQALELCGQFVHALLNVAGVYVQMNSMSLGFWVVLMIIVLTFIIKRWQRKRAEELKNAEKMQNRMKPNLAEQENVAPKAETGGSSDKKTSVTVNPDQTELIGVLKDQARAAQARVETLESEINIKNKTIARRETLLRMLGVRNFSTGAIVPGGGSFSVNQWNSFTPEQVNQALHYQTVTNVSSAPTAAQPKAS